MVRVLDRVSSKGGQGKLPPPNSSTSPPNRPNFPLRFYCSYIVQNIVIHGRRIASRDEASTHMHWIEDHEKWCVASIHSQLVIKFMHDIPQESIKKVLPQWPPYQPPWISPCWCIPRRPFQLIITFHAVGACHRATHSTVKSHTCEVVRVLQTLHIKFVQNEPKEAKWIIVWLWFNMLLTHF